MPCFHFLKKRSFPGCGPSRWNLLSLSTLEVSLHCVLVSLGCHNKIPQTECLNNRNMFSHSSGGWKSKTKVLASAVSHRPLSVACRWPPYCCVLTRPFLWEYKYIFTPGVSSSSNKDTGPIGLEPPGSSDLI